MINYAITSLRSYIFLVFASFALLFFVHTQTVLAADITVSSSCSLSDAITTSNTDTATGGCSAGSGIDSISLSGDVTLGAALPQITTAVTINGNSHTIDGASSYRIFDISTPYNSDGNAAAQRVITINNLTMRNGSSSEGGAIRVNGARADNLASLTLSNCNVYNSSSSAHAGGIFARNALLNVQSTTLMSGNSAAHSGGAIWADTSTVNIIGSSTLTYNTAGIYGGSIHAIDTTLTINQAAITDSTSAEEGGGLAYFYGSGRTVTITLTVISNNTSSKDGGGIYANLTNSTLAISSSTMFGNTDQTGSNDYRVVGSGTFTINGEAAAG